MKNVLREQVKSALAITLSVLREIFDENAYARFLAREGLVSGLRVERTTRHDFLMDDQFKSGQDRRAGLLD